MSQNLEESEHVPSARGWTWGAWLSEAPLLPADGPYLVIVEQPKQVSEPEVCMAWALGTSGVAAAVGWLVAAGLLGGRCPGYTLLVTWSVMASSCLVCVCGGGSPDIIVWVMEPAARLQISIWM